MNVLCTILLCAYFTASLSALTLNRSSRSSIEKNEVGEPLLLTPLINAGELDEARHQSHVEPLLDDIESYAGYFTANETTRSHLYFWYFPATDATDSSTPLILWLQGGPGISSLYGLFTENGPFLVTENGTLERRVHAWTNNYHVLYIDQPVGTGFSFTEHDGYIETEEEVGEQLYEALAQFYVLFSELETRQLYIAGEGYAGKFVPAIGYKIHSTNLQAQTPQPQIPLSGLIIGDGYSDGEYMQDYADHYYELGLIDEASRVELEIKQNKIKYLIRSGRWSEAADEVHSLWQDLVKLLDSISMADYTGDNFFLDYSSSQDFVQLDRVRERIHVGRVEYDMISEQVHEAFLVDMVKTVRPWIEELLEYYPMLFYSGQFDLLVPPSSTEHFLNSLHWNGAKQYGLAERQTWRVGDKVAGFYKSGANLAHVVVRNAGSYVPADQPENTLNLIDMFVGKKF